MLESVFNKVVDRQDCCKINFSNVHILVNINVNVNVLKNIHRGELKITSRIYNGTFFAKRVNGLLFLQKPSLVDV